MAKAKRVRINFKAEQFEEMEKVFSLNQYPDVQILEDLSNNLRLPVEKICTWFQNRRSKFRKEAKERVTRPFDAQTRNCPTQVQLLHQYQSRYVETMPSNRVLQTQPYTPSDNYNGRRGFSGDETLYVQPPHLGELRATPYGRPQQFNSFKTMGSTPPVPAHRHLAVFSRTQANSPGRPAVRFDEYPDAPPASSGSATTYGRTRFAGQYTSYQPTRVVVEGVSTNCGHSLTERSAVSSTTTEDVAATVATVGSKKEAGRSADCIYACQSATGSRKRTASSDSSVLSDYFHSPELYNRAGKMPKLSSPIDDLQPVSISYENDAWLSIKSPAPPTFDEEYMGAVNSAFADSFCDEFSPMNAYLGNPVTSVAISTSPDHVRSSTEQTDHTPPLLKRTDSQCSASLIPNLNTLYTSYNFNEMY